MNNFQTTIDLTPRLCVVAVCSYEHDTDEFTITRIELVGDVGHEDITSFLSPAAMRLVRLQAEAALENIFWIAPKNED